MKRVVLIMLALAVVLTGCGTTSQPAEKASAGVQTNKPVYVMAGIINANDKANITSKIGAKVAGISVDVGSVVKQGDTLLTLDTNDIQAQVNQAQAQVSMTQANLANAQAGARPEQIAQAQAALDAAQTAYNNAKTNFDRDQQLFQGGALPQAQLDAAQTVLSTAQSVYNSDQQQLDLLKKGSTQDQIDALKAQVQQAQAALDYAKAMLANGTIVAPISGTISAKSINVGELASPGETLLTITNNSSLFVNASLPADLAGSVKVGQVVAVKVSEIPNKDFSGTVSMVNSVVDSQNTSVLVKVQITDPDPALKPGMLAEIGLKK
ncbi:RND family efflux transporter, MFP subunit [Desulfosporosinus acidiphilus SJ4]|uniref:RND family efflux transporter, MFP subunit n=1 Tax=Desulfosporosinus acidiphilus (strain DSM 22704 / JCM 16185 / SJ4) TaxID=646529 RepID=I4DBC6_DESAJ|nr:efflux RND transporter periplasmic adaptor subunit [Desulfosporosinus acidiphilus]AFM43100.1 RND family efflux transporter, MFP subunit [Desulfosporosinus acidiphilus SJ4]